MNKFEKFATPISIIVAGALVGGGIIISKMNPSAPIAPKDGQPDAQATTVDKKTVASFIANDRIVLGDKRSKNIVIEVSDPSCPYCHFAAGLNTELAAQTPFKTVANGGTYTAPLPELHKLANEGKIAFVYTFGNGHGSGELAAESLYCANEVGKFWEAHDKIMSSAGYRLMNDTIGNDRAQSATLVEFLKDAVDSAFMSECLSSKRYESRIARDISENSKLNFEGTPHFIVNGKIVRGAQDWKTFKSLLGI